MPNLRNTPGSAESIWSGPRAYGIGMVMLVLATLAAFLPAIHAGWIWDDGVEVTRNALLRSSRGLFQIWFDAPGPDYFPLTSTVQWIEWQLWAESPLGYHLVSVGLHALSACLVWRVLAQLRVRWAFLGGLIFAVHPLAVESVVWVAELKNTLSLPPMLGSLSLFLIFLETGRRRAWALSLAWFVAALLCKSSVVMLPFVLLLATWWRGREYPRRTLAGIFGPFFAASLIAGLVTIWYQTVHAIRGIALPHPAPLRLGAGAGLAVWSYAQRCLAPLNLLPVYPAWTASSLVALGLLGWLAFAALLFLCWTGRATWGRSALLGVGFYFLNLVPVLGIVPMSYLRIAPIADHFCYISLIGLIGLGVAALGWLKRPAAAVSLGVGIAALFAVLSHRYAMVFHDEESLWTYTLARNPDSWTAHANLGSLLLGRHQIPESRLHLERAIALYPADPTARNNLGLVYRSRGDYAAAIEQYRAALVVDPLTPELHTNLGEALQREGKTPEAVAQFDLASHLIPDLAEEHNNLGNAYRDAAVYPSAVQQYRRTLALDPAFTAAHTNLADALAKSGDLPGAKTEAQIAVTLEPRRADGHAQLAVILAASGDLAGAVAENRKAVALDPRLAEALNNLGDGLAQMGQPAEAVDCFRRALAVKPAYFDAWYDLGNALVALNRVPEALTAYRQAEGINPRDADLQDNLATVLAALGHAAEAKVHADQAARLRLR